MKRAAEVHTRPERGTQKGDTGPRSEITLASEYSRCGADRSSCCCPRLQRTSDPQTISIFPAEMALFEVRLPSVSPASRRP